jgi:hypothetical protein
MSQMSPAMDTMQMASHGDTARVLRRTIIIGLTAFLTVVDLFATQAILPSLAQAYRVSPAAMSFAVNASTMGMAVAGLFVAFFSRQINRRFGILISLCVLAIPTALLASAPELWRYGLHLRDEIEAHLDQMARRLDPSRNWRDLVQRLREESAPEEGALLGLSPVQRLHLDLALHRRGPAHPDREAFLRRFLPHGPGLGLQVFGANRVRHGRLLDQLVVDPDDAAAGREGPRENEIGRVALRLETDAAIILFGARLLDHGQDPVFFHGLHEAPVLLGVGPKADHHRPPGGANQVPKTKFLLHAETSAAAARGATG